MNYSPPWPTVRPLARRLILGGAVLGALVVAFGPYAPPVQAGETYAESRTVKDMKVAQAEVPKPAKDAAASAKEAASSAKAAAQEAAKVADEDAKDAADSADDSSHNITIDRHGVRVEEGDSGKKKHRGVTIGIGGTDREYDSFEQFVHEDRGLAFMVVGIVFIVFLTPVLITGLLVWYKLRKNRMLTDSMVQLAEKGVVPTSEMLQAMQSGRTATAATAMAARASVVEQVKTLRSHAAWSDLRRGVILIAVGLSFTAYSMFDDRSPNWIGLVLLFLGIGYAFLWYFEDRQIAEPISAAPPPPPPAGGA
jgi:hypothetical protein